MTNNREPQEVPDWQRQAWLTEYQVCQQDSEAESTRYWTIFGIFISVNTAIIGGLIYGVFNTLFINAILKGENIPDTLVKLTILTILFVAIILITIFLESWLKRTNYLIQNNDRRMYEIEIELGMWKNLRIHINDKWNMVRKKLKYQKKPCDSQNINIWTRVWTELSSELPKEQFDTLYKDKQRIESIINQKPIAFERPNRFNAIYTFWAIRSLWILALLFTWSLLIFPFNQVLMFILYGVYLVSILFEIFHEFRKLKEQNLETI